MLIIIWQSNGAAWWNSSSTRTTRTPAFWDTPRRPMITHTSDSHQIPGVKVTNSKYLPKMIRCANMKWIRPVLWKIQSRHGFVHRQTDTRTDRQTHRQTDGEMDGRRETSIPPLSISCLLMPCWYCTKMIRSSWEMLHVFLYLPIKLSVPCIAMDIT